MLQNIGKGDVIVVPTETYVVCHAGIGCYSFGLKLHKFAFYQQRLDQHTIFPFFQVAYKAFPNTRFRFLKNLQIVVWRLRLQTKNLDLRSRLFVKMQARLNDACIVVNEQIARLQTIG